MSTLLKANKTRENSLFRRFYVQLIQQVKRKNTTFKLMLFPIDSTVITLTSKLFWL
ncbi:hypothetical protein [Synechococcus sp. PCC 6312]|uniref:hypothetical protein n=1 Tax=Synechococcus sp. (strain ATCC 27167 / PCC 6312) TaxID=195253 RepID=UPI00031D24AB|nr:hypothetical protein [Synechococcus sp. PCC 6312]